MGIYGGIFAEFFLVWEVFHTAVVEIKHFVLSIGFFFSNILPSMRCCGKAW